MGISRYATAGLRAARRAIYSRSYDPASLVDETCQAFRKYDMDFHVARDTLNSALRGCDRPPYDERVGMSSQHWLFFAGLTSLLPAKARILEIGTFDASFARILSALFPRGEIVTCDLPESSPIFRSTYGRDQGSARTKFLEKRDEKLLTLKNVSFVQCNSFLLPEAVGTDFDAVWVDGGHDYPDVAWDACNAYHLLRTGGFALFDDLYLGPRIGRTLSSDYNDSYDLLSKLQVEGLVDISYFPKRVISSASADPALRKHVGVFRK